MRPGGSLASLALFMLPSALLTACMTEAYYDPVAAQSGATDMSAPTVEAPDLGLTVRQPEAPPPISGGNLAVSADGALVVAADPDRDQVYIVELASSKIRTIPFLRGDEPGRVALDGAGRAHVALRRGGAVATVDLTSGRVTRREACPLPRGIAWEPEANAVHVVCAGGELVTLPAADGAAVVRATGVSDLRDVVVGASGLVVSTFRSAETLRVDRAGNISLDPRNDSFGATGVPRVAWRLTAASAGGATQPKLTAPHDLVLLAQLAPTTDVDMPAEYYDSSAGCFARGPTTAVTHGDRVMFVPRAVLATDVAVHGEVVALAVAGNARHAALPQILLVDPVASDEPWDPTVSPSPYTPCVEGRGISLTGQITSVAFAHGGRDLLALSREPSALYVIDVGERKVRSRLPLSFLSREDTGHVIFHANSGAGIACASCHPEGRDDGHTWRAIASGPRRTPSLLGTLAGTAPYHWQGEAADLSAVADLTYRSRMRGPALKSDQVDALSGWLLALPRLPASPSSDRDAITRGSALFESSASKCATCHSGVARTNNATIEMSPGAAFQVPSLLGVGLRAPYLHDGSALSLQALLAARHGGAVLTTEQLADLTVFLESL